MEAIQNERQGHPEPERRHLRQGAVRLLAGPAVPDLGLHRRRPERPQRSPARRDERLRRRDLQPVQPEPLKFRTYRADAVM